MKYKIELVAPVTREATIAAKLNTSPPPPTREFYGFRNRKWELPLISVPIGLPIYRMANFRTFTDQRDFIADEQRPADYFSNGQESEAVQQDQHKLLHRLAEKGKAESVVSVSTVLEKEGQRQPLLITASGVVVNGNRRLAAMREIYEDDRIKNAKFSHIDVLVLPADATAEEVVDIEANLQAMPETKLDYDWIGEAQLIKALVSLGRSHAQVADQLNRKEKEIGYAIQTLSEAELYLKEAVGVEGGYSEIREEAEQLFKDLPKLIEDKSEEKKQASRVIAWTLFQNKERLPSRLYDYNAAIGRLADDVIARIAEEQGLNSDEDDQDAGADGEDFDILLDPDATSGSTAAVIEALLGEDRSEAVDSLIEAAITVVELDKGQRSGKEALKVVTQAHSKLASVDISRAAATTHTAISKQLEAIKTIVIKLENELAKAGKADAKE